jgi:serine/threonine-protein kinase
MGEVFLVEQTRLGKRFAAKLLHAKLAGDARLLDRMRLEAETLGSIQHANIVTVFDFQSTRDGRPFVVMEYLKGRTLDAEIEICGPMAPEVALDFTGQLLSALEAAHALGIVHRDIKPSNLYLCDAVNGGRVLKVLDFGVVRVLPDAPENAPEPTAMPTTTGVLVGTPRYLSPEGAVGKKVDPRADLYSAALMLYIMLTGRGPFDEIERDTAMLAAHAHFEPPPPSQFAATALPPGLDEIVLHGLCKDPEDRYATAGEFKRSIDRFLSHLRCPPQLRETNVVGDVLSATLELQHTSSTQPLSSEPATNVRLTVWGAVVLFVLVGVVTTIVQVTTGWVP